MTLAEGIRFEHRVFHTTFATKDQKEGMAAFAEKRKPAFTEARKVSASTRASLLHSQKLVKDWTAMAQVACTDCCHVCCFSIAFIAVS